jgi:hypothetical protein
MDFPILIRVTLPGVYDAGQIDTELYCVNLTLKQFQVSTRSNSFTTVDEDVGTVIEHGSEPTEVILLPGEAKKVGDVAGWEWDGYVGIELRFKEDGSGEGMRVSYDLKRAAEGYRIEALGKSGRVVPPSYTRRI